MYRNRQYMVIFGPFRPVVSIKYWSSSETNGFRFTNTVDTFLINNVTTAVAVQIRISADGDLTRSDGALEFIIFYIIDSSGRDNFNPGIWYDIVKYLLIAIHPHTFRTGIARQILDNAWWRVSTFG